MAHEQFDVDATVLGRLDRAGVLQQLARVLGIGIGRVATYFIRQALD
jgi:hypothetical protein